MSSDGGHDAGPPFAAVGFMLSAIGYAVARGFSATLRPLGLEPRQFLVLRAVSAMSGSSQQAIGSWLQIPPSRMVSILDGLEARDLLERRVRPGDRRSRAVHLTPAGESLLGRAVALATDFDRTLCRDLAPDGRSQLIELLRSVGARVGFEGGPHHPGNSEPEPHPAGEADHASWH